MGQLITKIERIELPRPMAVCAVVLVSYFLVTAGIAFDIINEPPAIGGERDPATGKVKPVTFMPHRNNGQYIMEGLVGAFMYILGGLGYIALDKAHDRKMDVKDRTMIQWGGAIAIALSYVAVYSFMMIKMPNYLFQSRYMYGG